MLRRATRTHSRPAQATFFITFPYREPRDTSNVWYSPAGSGTFCAMTFDNLAGSHHIEVILRHEDWQTPWYDSGTYSTFAGGI
jgi:hypothetical protein